jgi:hypothetical protein
VPDHRQPITVPPPRSEPARGGPGLRGTGFAARLQDVTLWDLIQFECLQRSRRIVRVSNRDLLGFVFFRDGDVVHATTGHLTGEVALAEMLGWEDGAFETWTGAWPDRETITAPSQQVLLELAQATDEGRSPRVTSLPGRDEDAGRGVLSVVGSSSSPPAAAAIPLESITISEEGRLIRGSTSSNLAETAAYALGLGDFIGDVLGLDQLRAIEIDLDAAHFLVARASEGKVIAARAGRPEELDRFKKGRDK